MPRLPVFFQTMSILIIDDDRELGEMLVDFLAGEGLSATVITCGTEGLEEIRRNPPEAIVLDVMLPGMSGFDVLRAIRSQSSIPVIMLTARGEDTDRIVGLELGADDYLPKPFNPRELAARLRAVLRRSAPGESPGHRTTVGELSLDPTRRTVDLNGEALALTGAEFDILARLIRDPGEIVSKDELARSALGRELAPFDRSVDTHVSRLRGKIGPLPDDTPRIRSVRGRGYMYVIDSHEPDS